MNRFTSTLGLEAGPETTAMDAIADMPADMRSLWLQLADPTVVAERFGDLDGAGAARVLAYARDRYPGPGFDPDNDEMDVIEVTTRSGGYDRANIGRFAIRTEGRCHCLHDTLDDARATIAYLTGLTPITLDPADGPHRWFVNAEGA